MSKNKSVARPAAKQSNIIGFFSETNQEIKKVSWPTRKYISSSTVLVLLIVFVLSIFVTVLDWGFARGIGFLIK